MCLWKSLTYFLWLTATVFWHANLSLHLTQRTGSIAEPIKVKRQGFRASEVGGLQRGLCAASGPSDMGVPLTPPAGGIRLGWGSGGLKYPSHNCGVVASVL